MIRIEAVAIRELRGIRDLEVKPDRKNFVVSGPNGSGKSGVVDAIEFALTGVMSRLSGKGTRGLSVKTHGPHVDRRDDPASAEVSLRFYVPELEKSAVLTRNVKNPRAFVLAPDDPEIRRVIEEVADHPELTLTRREIIKYVIVEAAQRSKEIQELLKLGSIGQTRGVLKTVLNRLTAAAKQTKSALGSAEEALRLHLDVTAPRPEDILAAINPHRQTLGLGEITRLAPDTDFTAGTLEASGDGGFNRNSALRDVEALRSAVADLATLRQEAVWSMLRDLDILDSDPAIIEAITRRSFVEAGLRLVDNKDCPLCDSGWEDAEALKAHLRAKLAKADEADALQQSLLDGGATIADEARRIAALVDPVQPLGERYGLEGLAEKLGRWSSDLKAFATGLGTVEAIAERRDRLEDGWTAAPGAVGDQLGVLQQMIESTPDQSASVAAQTFLTRAQDRFSAWRSAQHERKRAEVAVEAGRTAYKTYCDVADVYLSELYRSVEDRFGTYYRAINGEDEGGFKVKLEQAEAGLDLRVAFHDTGLHAPAAYHSEGHQDGMGVCLYLALMKHLLGDRFRFAVLDDVVMSVDRGHRKEFCRLLKAHFPDTQFIITTHDKVWAKQMQTEGLVESKGGLTLQNWSVETGPIVEQAAGVWDKIESDVAKGETPVAAGRLRRHMEYVGAELADRLGAKPPFRGDYSYDSGDLVSAVIGRHGELLKLGARAANKWNSEDAKAKVAALKESRKEALDAYHGEQWVLNKAIHFNEWAQFTKSELREVVEAFKRLLEELRCASCGSWLYVTPRKGTAENLRCDCGSVMVNLKVK